MKQIYDKICKNLLHSNLTKSEEEIKKKNKINRKIEKEISIMGITMDDTEMEMRPHKQLTPPEYDVDAYKNENKRQNKT